MDRSRQLQVIVAGDFYQLPPIAPDKNVPAKFAFESEAWGEVVPDKFSLTQVYRQRDPGKCFP